MQCMCGRYKGREINLQAVINNEDDMLNNRVSINWVTLIQISPKTQNEVPVQTAHYPPRLH